MRERPLAGSDFAIFLVVKKKLLHRIYKPKVENVQGHF